MAAVADLRSLRDRPFELLLEMERRATAVQAGRERGVPPGDEWVGIAFSLSGVSVLARREEVREVMSCLPATPIPGAKKWVVGLSNVRGQLLPVIDLSALLTGVQTQRTRSTRILSVNHKHIPAGLMVDEIYGFRHYVEGEHSEKAALPFQGVEEYMTGSFTRSGQSLPVISLQRLVESERFLSAAR